VFTVDSHWCQIPELEEQWLVKVRMEASGSSLGRHTGLGRNHNIWYWGGMAVMAGSHPFE